MPKELKLEGGVPSGKLKAPPKSCIPKSAKMRMKRPSRNSREMMERIELKREMTRLRREDQYLVTLKMRKSRRARRTERPKEPAWVAIFVQQTSKTLARITMQSKRLKEDSK